VSGLTLVVAPEPAAWVAPLCAELSAQGPVQLVAPWAVPQAWQPWLGHLNGIPGGARISEGLGRRRGPAVPTWHAGIWAPAALVLPIWAGQYTHRQYEGRFFLRAQVDAWAAARITPAVTCVVAPTLGARAVFAAALKQQAQTVLVHDLPLLRRLHGDLDAAARRWPECSFLNRHRAHRRWWVRQEAEWVLTRAVRARGAYAEAGLRAGGVAAPITPLEPAPETAPRSAVGGAAQPVVRLAGPPLGRSGAAEVAAALAEMPELIVEIRRNAVVEPAALHAHPRVRWVSPDAGLSGVSAVLAPAWAEGSPPEIAEAARLGIPVVCSPAAAGWLSEYTEVTPGDVSGLVAALRGILNPALSS
jgi:hypothetical protein